MNENINLCELLKGHEGETFYSPTFGNIVLNNAKCSPLYFDTIECTIDIRYDGKYCDEGEVCIFPSKDQRDWNKWVEEQKPKVPKTWSEVEKCNGEVWQATNLLDYGTTVPILKSTLALLKIYQLIEVGYGGNLSFKEKLGPNRLWMISINDFKPDSYKIEIDECGLADNLLVFHTREQAEEFLSYPENVQLVKDFFMI